MSNELAGPARQAGVSDGAAVSDTAPLAAISSAARPAAPDVRRPGGRRHRTGHARGRRYRDGRPAHPAPLAEEPTAVEISSFPSLASPPKALARMFAVCLASCLLAAWLHIDLIAGLGFCAGCVFATRYARPQALLHVVLSIPVIFLAAELIVELISSGGGGAHRTVLSVFEGTVLTLAAVAPWLFVGTTGALAIAIFRGLPQCIRDMRTEARGDVRPTARRG